MSESVEEIHNYIMDIANKEINNNIQYGSLLCSEIYNFEEGVYFILDNKRQQHYTLIRILPKTNNSIYKCNLDFEIKKECYNYNNYIYNLKCDNQSGIHFISEYHHYTVSINGINHNLDKYTIYNPKITKIIKHKDQIYLSSLGNYVNYYNIIIDNTDKYNICIINFKDFYNSYNLKTKKSVIDFLLNK
jgi:hypothetical protein